VITNNT